MMAAQSTAILFEGTSSCPAGGIFRALDSWVSADDATGTVTFAAACTGGRGIFTIPSGGGTVQTIALQTETTTAGAGFSFDAPTISGPSVAFEGARTGVFRVSCRATGCGPITTVGAPLTPAPGLAGEVLSTIELELLVGQGDLIAFGATTTGTSRRGVLLASDDGTLTLVAADGLAFPGTTVEPLDVLFGSSVAADKRGVALAMGISDSGEPTATDGLYLWRGGSLSEVARNQQPAPNGGLYGSFDMPLLTGGRVYALADTSLGTCFVRAAPGTGTALTCEGDSLPTPPGGTLGSFEADDAGLGSRGPVFRATVATGTASECLFTPKAGSVTAVACQGDLLPHGGRVGTFASTVIGASRRRVVAYTTNDGLSSVLYHFSNRARARLAGPGVATPVGGTYLLTNPLPSVSGKTVVFVSDVDLGSTTSAVFSAILRR